MLAGLPVLTLEPEEWHKQRLLEPKHVEGRLTEYFRQRGYCGVRVVASAAADQLTANLEAAAEETRRIRLKRVYEVCLETSDGQTETRFVLAKSVGWGWLSYHAFLVGQHLAGFVPPMLGLRDGILYTQWLPQSAENDPACEDCDARIQTTARYVAARTRFLGVGKVSADFGRNSQHEGFSLLSKVLSKAYGGVAIAGLRRPRVLRRLADMPCALPTLIDGRMRRCEWIKGPAGILKTDFEHHGLGKNELNVTDPAYDLAEAIFHLDLSPEEERTLVGCYAKESGDAGVGQRLFLYKLLAGVWAMTSALKSLVYQPQLDPSAARLSRAIRALLAFSDGPGGAPLRRVVSATVAALAGFGCGPGH